MSIFRPTELACPRCGIPVPFNEAHSVNADRRPDLRAAILDGTFQRETCPYCATAFRLDPQLTYLDMGRRQWLLAAPRARLDEWGALEAAARAAFARGFGAGASPSAQALGRTMQVRLVFGWAGLREKLLCAEAGLDDATLELLKLSLIESERGLVSDRAELRLLAPEADALVLGLIDPQSEALHERLTVPRPAYDAIAAAPDEWAALRADLTEGPFVDLHRLLVPATPE